MHLRNIQPFCINFSTSLTTYVIINIHVVSEKPEENFHQTNRKLSIEFRFKGPKNVSTCFEKPVLEYLDLYMEINGRFGM